MNRGATRVLWSMCCCWALTGCVASEDIAFEAAGDITADATVDDGAGDAEPSPQDSVSTEVTVDSGALADVLVPQDSEASTEVVPSEDSTPPQDGGSAGDTVSSGDIPGAEDIESDEGTGAAEDVLTPEGCQEPNPAGCTQTLCGEDEVCDPAQGCKPSSCFCDEASGEWSCSQDCGGGVCVPKEIEESVCPGPNPQGCVETGCPDGYSCVSDPEICVPSQCSCEEESANWECTDDCGGGVCQKDEESPCAKPDPTSCSVIGCAPGFECDLEINACGPSSCTCDEEAGEWNCSKDCLPGECVPVEQDQECLKPDPTSCSVAGCKEGYFCDLEIPVCGPSSCTCDAATGFWTCTKDCLPGQCMPLKPDKGCLEPDPTSCSVIGCQDGFMCDLEAPGCSPSSCTCDKENGGWICTEDCLPGQCVPGVIAACTEDEIKTPDGCMSCDEVLAFVTANAQVNAESASAGCQADEDCVMAQAESGCLGLCPVAVKSMWALKYVDKIKLVSDDYCKGYQEKCSFAIPACEPSEAACVGGTCQAVAIP